MPLAAAFVQRVGLERLSMDVRVLVAEAIRSENHRAVAAAVEAFIDVGRRAHGGDAAASLEYYGLYYDLLEGFGRLGDPVCAWIAASVDPLEDAAATYQGSELPADVSAHDFVAFIRADFSKAALTPHPLSHYMFRGAPTRSQIRTYIAHNWYRSRGFFRLLVDFAAHLDLQALPNIIENVYDEIGGLERSTPHPEMLRKLVTYLGADDSYASRPPWVAAQAYLANRLRACRHREPAWGLGVLVALEYSTPSTHRSIHDMLARADVPEDAREFFFFHMTHDVHHADELLELVPMLLTTDAARQAFMRSLHRHRFLRDRYLDLIWEIVQEDGRPVSARA
jgi:pyrroloquinoline quinone (PQQ) biosynthesis protein C